MAKRKVYFMLVDDQVYQALVIKELKHEARLSDRQVKRMEWADFTDGRILRTRRDREVKLSDELFNAIASLPVQGRRVFKMESSSLFLEMPECPPRRDQQQIIEDDKTRLARLIAEKLLD